jgi:hypothetical protein
MLVHTSISIPLQATPLEGLLPPRCQDDGPAELLDDKHEMPQAR